MARQSFPSRMVHRARGLLAGVICFALLVFALPVLAQTQPSTSAPAEGTGAAAAPAIPPTEPSRPPGSDAKAHTTNLAVVAPGIAEALLATALGLAAAIPAVVIYNYLARSIAGCKALFANISTEVINLVSREIAQPVERKRAAVVSARLPAE